MTIVARMLAALGFNVLVPSLFNMFGVPGTNHIGAGADLQAKHSDGEFLAKMDEAWRYLTGRMHSDPARTAVFCGGKDYIATPAVQGPLWQNFIASGRLVEWHFFSEANHGFRHPDNAGFQPHYADLVWPLVTDFLQRTV
jgi:dienelactone hydrolase